MRIIKGGKTARCAAATLADLLDYNCILQGDKCIQCCVRTGIGGMKCYNLVSGDGEPVETRQVMIICRRN
jgi:hypothetical protein